VLQGSTLAGVFLAEAIAVHSPTAGVIVALIVVLQLAIESVIATSLRRRGRVHHPADPAALRRRPPGSVTETLLGGRIVDTLIGAALGIAARRLL
jgi:hypothetical protein